jgi:putative aminopeptidase FrvX
VDPSVLEQKSDDEVTLCSRLDEVGFVVDMVKEEEPKGY